MGLAAAQREQKSAPQAVAAARALRAPVPSVASPSPWGRIAVLQRTFGNQAAQRIMQRRPLVSEPGDPYEREADRVAEQVTAAAVPAGPGAAPLAAGAPAALQRACSCGGTCAECQEEDQRPIQRKAATASSPAEAAPPIVDEVLRSPGQPLDPATRAFMEQRFSHDFCRVRVHTDARAAESAKSVHALAYTVGSDVVFGSGQYLPQSAEGRKLVAHELAHVVQQGSVVEAAMPPIRRKVKVEKPKDNIPNPGGKGLVRTNAKTIQDYLTTLCPTGSVAVDPATGEVGISASFCAPIPLWWGPFGPVNVSQAQVAKTSTGCSCLCDLTSSPHPWRISVDDTKWPQTNFDDHDAAIGKKPGGTGGTVTAPSPNSTKIWGAAAATGKELDIDPWLVLGHELCGHGWLGNAGSHAPDEAQARGEGGHQATVARENALRAEHGIDLRGTFKDPNCGESYWRDKSAPGKVNWSGFHAVCESWRARYNAAHGTKYKITDKMP